MLRIFDTRLSISAELVAFQLPPALAVGSIPKTLKAEGSFIVERNYSCTNAQVQAFVKERMSKHKEWQRNWNICSIIALILFVPTFVLRRLLYFSNQPLDLGFVTCYVLFVFVGLFVLLFWYTRSQKKVMIKYDPLYSMMLEPNLHIGTNALQLKYKDGKRSRKDKTVCSFEAAYSDITNAVMAVDGSIHIYGKILYCEYSDSMKRDICIVKKEFMIPGFFDQHDSIAHDLSSHNVPVNVPVSVITTNT